MLRRSELKKSADWWESKHPVADTAYKLFRPGSHCSVSQEDANDALYMAKNFLQAAADHYGRYLAQSLGLTDGEIVVFEGHLFEAEVHSYSDLSRKKDRSGTLPPPIRTCTYLQPLMIEQGTVSKQHFCKTFAPQRWACSYERRPGRPIQSAELHPTGFDRNYLGIDRWLEPKNAQRKILRIAELSNANPFLWNDAAKQPRRIELEQDRARLQAVRVATLAQAY